MSKSENQTDQTDISFGLIFLSNIFSFFLQGRQTSWRRHLYLFGLKKGFWGKGKHSLSPMAISFNICLSQLRYWLIAVSYTHL
ncbi:hypothetical protein, partial [Methanosarcina sp. 2.H.T.1A.15]|uniref:hypothetical protein n=1 Tax=Methanosarcina sp. 2.H.T.1A.15 TaxID=1483596 RepID=UPI001F38E38A